MTQSNSIRAIVSAVGPDDAEDIVRTAAEGGVVSASRKLFYPYYALAFRYTASTFIGPSTWTVACLVDSLTGLGATADPFELEALEPDLRDVVAPRLDAHEAERVARRYTGYVQRNRRRALMSPAIDIVSCRVVYKPFWVVLHDTIGSVLVDGVTGGFYPLRAVR